MSGQIDRFKSKTKKDKQNRDPKSDIQKPEEPKFKVYINAGEMKRIHEWVMRHQDIQTGYGQIVLVQLLYTTADSIVVYEVCLCAR